jgi:hypothetical protein
MPCVADAMRLVRAQSLRPPYPAIDGAWVARSIDRSGSLQISFMAHGDVRRCHRLGQFAQHTWYAVNLATAESSGQSRIVRLERTSIA